VENTDGVYTACHATRIYTYITTKQYEYIHTHIYIYIYIYIYIDIKVFSIFRTSMYPLRQQLVY